MHTSPLGDPKKFRVGVLMKSLTSSVYISRTINELSENQDIDLVLLMESHESRTKLQTYRHNLRFGGFRRLISLIAFALMFRVESKILRRQTAELLARDSIDSALFVETINIKPIFSKSWLFSRYSKEDVQKINNAELDIIVRGNGGAILRGGILTASRLGFISFHHGDNRWNRGGPPGFWEVYKRKPASGFMIQMLTDKLDGGHVIFRGAIASKRMYSENLQQLFAQSNPYMSHVILGLLRGQIEMKFEPNLPIDQPLYKVPSFWITVQYALRSYGIMSRQALNKIFFKRYPRWSIGYCRDSWRDANLSKLTLIKNPSYRFLADPFVLTRDDKAYIFAEDYDYRTSRGSISCIVVDQDESVQLIEKIIDEDFHLSFPYVFEHNGDVYMIPESSESHSIRLYRSTRFPSEWKFEMELMSNVSAVDSMVMPYDNRWFLLTNIGRGPDSDYFSSQLDVFVADQLKTTVWKPISYSPQVFDPSAGRNAGILFDDDGSVYRVRQSQGISKYGEGFSIAKIIELNPTEYQETEIGRYSASFRNGIDGAHHMHSNGGITVVDFSKTEHLSN